MKSCEACASLASIRSGSARQAFTPLAEVKAQHKPEMGQDGGPVVTVAGRVMLSAADREADAS